MLIPIDYELLMEENSLTSLFIESFTNESNDLNVFHENDDGSTLTGHVRIESESHYQVYIPEKGVFINITVNEAGKLNCNLGKRKNQEWVEIICFLVSEKIKESRLKIIK